MAIARRLVGVGLVVVVGVCELGGGPTVQAQELEQLIYVSVVRRGAPVTDLTADEFIVKEDGRTREVLSVERASVPVQIALLVDDSYGLARNLSHVRSGLTALIDALPDNHQTAFITFGDQMRSVVDYTSDKARLKAAVGEYAPFSETSSVLLNALASTAYSLTNRGAIRPIIILITTEGANASVDRLRAGRQGSAVVSPRGGQGLGHEQVLEVLRETKTAVHSLIVRSVGVPDFASIPDASAATRGLLLQSDGDRDRAAVFEQLPRVTGGGREELGATSALSKLLTRVADEINNQYLVTYARPLALIPPEEIEVSVTRRRLTVRSTPARPLPLR